MAIQVVVGEAADPVQARSRPSRTLNPDVLTLDVEMPRMSGLDFLERIMRLRPMPVVMVSTLTSRGAEATLAGAGTRRVRLRGQAADCDDRAESFDRLIGHGACGGGRDGCVLRPTPISRPAPAMEADFRPEWQGAGDRFASTGGVEALLAILSKFPSNCPPTVITQHMPATFTASFAQRLNRSCAASVT